MSTILYRLYCPLHALNMSMTLQTPLFMIRINDSCWVKHASSHVTFEEASSCIYIFLTQAALKRHELCVIMKTEQDKHFLPDPYPLPSLLAV